MKPICLTIISVVDLVWGTGGGITVTLWIGYGVYKLFELED